MTQKRWIGDFPPGSIAYQNERTGSWHFSIPLWQHWYQIARLNADRAIAMRRSDEVIDIESYNVYNSADPRQVPDSTPVPPPGAEMYASMVAVTAAAFAVDGFYGSVRKFVKLPRSNASRSRKINETLKLGFNVGRQSQLWRTDLDWLFKTRDGVVHSYERQDEVVLLRETSETVIYGAPDLSGLMAPSADRAAKVAAGIISTCLLDPKPATREWAEEASKTVFEIET